MFENIRNVYCVGRNYKAHAEELGNEVPKEPMLFTKPTHALAAMDGGTVLLPGTKGEVHFEGELVLHIGRSYEPGIRADELIDRMTLGLDLTLRDVQTVIKGKGQPWLPAKGFKNSAPVSRWVSFPGVEALKEKDFTLLKNGSFAQRGNVSRMIFDVQHIVDYCAAQYGLGAGDIIFTGTPEGVGPVLDGDLFEMRWDEETLGSCRIQLS